MPRKKADPSEKVIAQYHYLQKNHDINEMTPTDTIQHYASREGFDELSNLNEYRLRATVSAYPMKDFDWSPSLSVDEIRSSSAVNEGAQTMGTAVLLLFLLIAWIWTELLGWTSGIGGMVLIWIGIFTFMVAGYFWWVA